MKIDSTINKILYVPFNEDYSVDTNIQKILTEEEFFEECFYMPDFEEEIKELVEKTEEEINAFEIDLTKEELLEKYQQNKREKEAFFNWIENNQNDIYCVKGDAGIGKTTFVHYLEYVYRNTLTEWDIIDMTKSIEAVKILNNKLSIPRFNNIFYKSVSVIIKKLVDGLIESWDDGKIDYEKSSGNIEQIMNNYSQFEGYYPITFVNDFFEGIKVIGKKNMDDKTYVENCSKFIFDYFDDYLKSNKREKDEVISNILELYVYYVCCKNITKKYFLAFDNLEKFIGTDEIYDKQLISFVSKIRHIQKTVSENNVKLASKFQIAIFMRNTSTRMFTPQQIAEIFPHIVELSEWFQSAKVIQKKIEWYRTKGIDVDEAERLLDIINDIGHGKNDDFKGLRSKLNMLFNNDKRVVVNILTKVLDNASNGRYLKEYDLFRKNSYNIEKSYAKFAKRTIIFTLILNELKKDGFFSNIAVEHDVDKMSLGYARKILTILYDYKLVLNDGYMKLDDIIIMLDNREINAVERYFVKYNRERRKTVSKVLYYMNYYDGRANNWLQFIDIQYNINQNETRIKSDKELDELIENHHENINIRITSAGIAYLFFVVYSYEYFACKSSNLAPREYLSNNGSLPPLLCVIPSKRDILEKNVDELLCVKILKFVSNEAIKCIEKMQKDKNGNEKTIPFRKGIHDKYIEHGERIINSHVGFIDNYIECIKQMYYEDLRVDVVFWEKFENLKSELSKMKKEYQKWR